MRGLHFPERFERPPYRLRIAGQIVIPLVVEATAEITAQRPLVVRVDVLKHFLDDGELLRLAGLAVVRNGPITLTRKLELGAAQQMRRPGVVDLVRYTAIDDVGRAINPLLIDGQTHGGIAQGAGQALMEEIRYDPETGQLLSGTFMDYAMPRARDFPSFVTAITEVPAPTNPLGVKPGSEGGTAPAPAVITNAIVDALRDYGVRHIEIPATPERVWQAMRAGKAGG